jgi:hypothetical protein
MENLTMDQKKPLTWSWRLRGQRGGPGGSCIFVCQKRLLPMASKAVPQACLTILQVERSLDPWPWELELRRARNPAVESKQ